MTVKSSRRRAEQRQEAYAMRSRSEWQVDDLEDAELANFINLTSPHVVNDDHVDTDQQELVFVGTKSKIPYVRAAKQDPTKPGFFDLPAELRTEIYLMHCEAAFQRGKYGSVIVMQTLFPDENDTIRLWEHRGGIINYHASPVVQLPPAKEWKTHCPFIINNQLICHQFTDEFIPVWASECTFELKVPMPRFFSGSTSIPHIPEARCLWFYVRDFLFRLESLTRRYLRSILLKWELPVSHSHQTLYNCREYLKTLNELDGKDVCSLFERLNDVHADLEIELEVCLKRVRDTESGAKRIFTLKQQSPEVVRNTGGPDWISRDGPILVKAPRLNLVHGLPWKVLPYNLDALPHRAGELF